MDEKKPKYLIAAERRAAQLGIPVEKILDDDRDAVMESDYPTTDCFDSWEIDELAQGREPEQYQLRHLEACDSCRALLAVAKQLKKP